ncbi:MAG: multiple sugar transport system permease protein [Gaiellales bacterium]|nr:multiple sugar transport system permease protein [Gaiellales bacterium]
MPSVRAAGRSERPAARRRGRSRRTREALFATAFLAPSVLLLGLFVIAPALWAVRNSFMSYSLNGIDATSHHFVGFANYRALLSDPDFRTAVVRTGWFVLASAVVGQFILGLAAALALARRDIRARGAFGAAIILPLAVPETVAALTWASMLAAGGKGTANRALALTHLGPIEWIATHAMLSIIIVNIWRGVAFAAILFGGALEAVPASVVEAARVDGAGAPRLFWYVTLPLIKHAIALYMLMTVIGTVTLFGLVFFLTQGGPGSDTTLASIYIYLQSFKFFEFGIGSAASVLLLCLVVPLGVIYTRLLRARI